MLSSSTTTTSSVSGYRTPSHKGATTTAAAATNEPNLELTMLEYYLFLFVRFPLSNPTWLTQMQDQSSSRSTRGTSSSSSSNAMYGQRIYSHLFTNYMNSYLSLGQEYNEDSLDVGMNCFDCSTTTTTTTTCQQYHAFVVALVFFGASSPFIWFNLTTKTSTQPVPTTDTNTCNNSTKFLNYVFY